MRYLLTLVLLLSSALFADDANKQVEMKYREELNQLLSRILPKSSFILQVSGAYSTNTEKRLVENLVMKKQPMQEKKSPPSSMPGFMIPDSESSEILPAEESKEVYQYHTSEVLKSLNVQVFVDKTLAKEKTAQAELATKSYLKSQVSVPNSLSIVPIELALLPEENNLSAKDTSSTQTDASVDDGLQIIDWVAIIIAVQLFLLLLLLGLRLFKKRPIEEKKLAKPVTIPNEQSMINNQIKEDNSDLVKAQMMNQVLLQPNAFKNYFEEISTKERTSLTNLMKGPAFFEISKALHLDQLTDKDVVASQDTDLEYFAKDFSDYVKAYSWQTSQFFGYLVYCDAEKLATYFHTSDPLNSAVIIRFLSASKASEALSLLPLEKRSKIIEQSSSASSINFSQLIQIEKDAREYLDKTPGVAQALSKTPHDVWKEIVLQSDDQEQMLKDIEKSTPELYQSLAKLRFTFDDIIDLDDDVVLKVLSHLDNDKLAKSMIGMPSQVKEFLLTKLSTNRRSLIKGQMSSLKGISEQEKKQAQISLLAEFRKELS